MRSRTVLIRPRLTAFHDDPIPRHDPRRSLSGEKVGIVQTDYLLALFTDDVRRRGVGDEIASGAVLRENRIAGAFGDGA